jgi:hypothetical protein
MSEAPIEPGRMSERPVEVADATPAEPVPGTGSGSVERSRPILTGMARLAAFGVAFVADAIQFVLFPLFGIVGSQFPVVVIDVVTAIILWRLVGWHWAFLPAFVAEVVPFVDLFPTWTLAVAFVMKGKSKKK